MSRTPSAPTVPVSVAPSLEPGVWTLRAAANAPLIPMEALPLAVKKSTEPNGVLKEPVAFRVSPTWVSEMNGVPVAENDAAGAKGTRAVRDAENPPLAVLVLLPFAVNQSTAPSGVLKVPVACRVEPVLVEVELNDNDG